VHLLGYVRRPEDVYGSADVFCLPTLSEGSALVCFEAMASGLPLVTTREAGSPAEHEQQALICPAGDSAALARALQRLRDDVDLRVRLGEAGRRLAEAYTWESYGERLVSFYCRLLPW
jgi:glycosyltransferase involved in cell wall biosynthesis